VELQQEIVHESQVTPPDPITETQDLDGSAAMFKSVETRFASKVSMTERAMQQKKVFKTLAKDELFLEWLGRQPKVIRLEVQALVCMTLLFSYFKYSYFPVYLLIVIFLCVRNIYYIIHYIIYV
jgi:hypothetical protein